MNRVSEPLDRSKMTINLELKLSLSNFSRGIEKQKLIKVQILNFHASSLYIFNTLFLIDFANFQKEADCLSVNSLIDRDPK